MSSSDKKVRVDTSLSPNELEAVTREVARRLGLTFKFAAGSNPSLHFHIGMGDACVEQFTDQSSGATGAKSFGPASSATSHGNVANFNANVGDLRSAVGALRDILDSTSLPETSAAESAEVALVSMEQELETSAPDRQRLQQAWASVQSFMNGCLAVGIFAVDKAVQVKAIVTKVASLL